ncbi:uncharacterized protein LOC114282171 [Camellia sinensis]|uniref:uncharacterized protein LOC114282171 n=1 Tax=Camellia sinensis TaxID=4442 RepID=UPI001036B0B4|nr:uncharacterized protein LOC114282171 [Camellia sinensis]
MTSSSTIFSFISPSTHLLSIHTADDSLMSVSHVGTVSRSQLSLPQVYHIPALTLNLISISQLCELGLIVTFSTNGCLVQDPQTEQTIGINHKHGRLYELIQLHVPDSPQIAAPASTSSLSHFRLWYCHLGHLSISRLKSLVSSGQLGHVLQDTFDCSSFIETPLLIPDPGQTVLLDGPPLLAPFSPSPPSLPALPPTDFLTGQPHRQAMTDELQALDKIHTWDVVDLPSGKTAIGCKWTFSLVARLTSVHNLLAVTAARHWNLFQMDVKSAFLNGNHLEEVYIQPPPGSTYPIHKHVTCGTVLLLSIASADQPVDVFTKAHPPGRFNDLVSKLTLVDAYPP